MVCVSCSTENWQQGQTILPEEVNYMLSLLRERDHTTYIFVVNVHFGDKINFSGVF